jgi:hypothetical protein
LLFIGLGKYVSQFRILNKGKMSIDNHTSDVWLGKDIGCFRNIRCLGNLLGRPAGCPYIVGTSETQFRECSYKRNSSRIDIGCLPDIRCLGKLLFGEMRIEQTVLALQKTSDVLETSDVWGNGAVSPRKKQRNLPSGRFLIISKVY